MDFHDRRFDSIQALRGITALFIVLEHIRFLNCGAFGVDIFFCISGFMIMFSTHKDASHFLLKRLIRIVPLYWLMTFATFFALLLFPGLFAESKASAAFLIKSLLFLPFDIGNGVIQPLMRIGWTVNCEIFFYLLFFAALRISRRYRGLLCSGLLVLLVAVSQLTATDFAPLAFYGSPVMLEFALGILLYYLCRGIYRVFSAGRLPRFLLPVSLLVTACCFLGLLLTKPRINILGFRRPLVWGLPAALIVLCVFTAGLFLRFPPSLARLGDISFSLYFMHYYPVMLLDRAVFDFSACTPYSLFGAALSLAFSVVLALICHELIEKRLSGWLRRVLLR